MQIDTAIRPLGFVDSSRLIERVLATEERAWYTDNRRQDDYEVHAQTQSIILVFFTGWPEVHVTHAHAWDAFNDVTMPIIDQIVATHYPPGGLILRAVLARVLPDCSIHVPLVTNPKVQFMVGSERIATQPGQAFELNNKLPHSVENHGDTARIHLIVDYAPD